MGTICSSPDTEETAVEAVDDLLQVNCAEPQPVSESSDLRAGLTPDHLIAASGGERNNNSNVLDESKQQPAPQSWKHIRVRVLSVPQATNDKPNNNHNDNSTSNEGLCISNNPSPNNLKPLQLVRFQTSFERSALLAGPNTPYSPSRSPTYSRSQSRQPVVGFTANVVVFKEGPPAPPPSPALAAATQSQGLSFLNLAGMLQELSSGGIDASLSRNTPPMHNDDHDEHMHGDDAFPDENDDDDDDLSPTFQSTTDLTFFRPQMRQSSSTGDVGVYHLEESARSEAVSTKDVDFFGSYSTNKLGEAGGGCRSQLSISNPLVHAFETEPLDDQSARTARKICRK